MNRRQFFQTTAGAAGLLLARRRAYAFQQTPVFQKFTLPLPGLGPSGIPVATPVSPSSAPTDIYHLDVREFQQQILPPPYGQTTFWGYVDANPNVQYNPRYLGPLIVAQRDRPVQLIVTNKLPNKHILPVDTTLMGAEADQFVNRTAVHLHGGLSTWNYDGGPFAWFTPGPWNAPGKNTGISFVNGTGVDGQAHYYYPNQQSARLMWYHDHAMGITRLNAYAGIAAGYLVQDAYEARLVKLGIIPSTQVPLIIQDKAFSSDGRLWYPSIYEGGSDHQLPELPEPWVRLRQGDVDGMAGNTGRWDVSDGTPPAPISCIPEFFADTILVNGAPYPYASLPPAPVRLRILNGSQARFYNLQLYYESSSVPGEADLTKPGPAMVQIGSEGGFLSTPVVLNNPPKRIGWDTNSTSPTFGNVNRYTLLLAPAERADLIVDLSGAAGRNLILYNDAPAPFPGGDQRNDYYTRDLDMTPIGGAPATLPGQGPNTRTIMKLVVGTSKSSNIAAAPVDLSSLVASLTAALAPMAQSFALPSAVRTRDVTLNEDFDSYGRLIQRLGTNRKPPGSTSFGRSYMDPATETPHVGDSEVWRIFNLTGDTHPIHFHIVNVQVVGRQPFDAQTYDGTPRFTGAFRPPDANEWGTKETVRVNPNEMTMIMMQFTAPSVPFKVPISPRTGGWEYVWHCHILEHEEHDMMRPLIVTP